ncbi:uncharacterized protein FIBRA_01795 [Fibroporia radiculosa]|uniref:Uncharacterized protein n=1 Tax=Fibroporia radiculosa TaxID=599839 RepID=J4G167_9APHY|nr:uncharacterized protein FIBRA_01795 [Fibroporia radiculosa]CCL99773.1 predicted protein [Fibroporia radiculosa]
MNDSVSAPNIIERGVFLNRRKKQIQLSHMKQRTILALALLIQVTLQWAWGVLMFVSPSYSQTACSANTVLLFFFVPLTAQEINDDKFYVWVLWLLFCLGITLLLTIVLSVSSRTRAGKTLSRRSTLSSPETSASTPVYRQLYNTAIASIPPWQDRKKQLIFWGNIGFACLWILYIVLSELQIRINCIFDGENNFGGFGQITALFLALTPVWSLTVALYRYPSQLRRRRRRELEALAAAANVRTMSPDTHSHGEASPHPITFQRQSPTNTRSAASSRVRQGRRMSTMRSANGGGDYIELQLLPGNSSRD